MKGPKKIKRKKDFTMPVPLTAIDFKIIELADAYLATRGNPSRVSTRRMWDQVSRELFEIHHVKLDVRRRVVMMKKAIARILKFIDNPAYKESQFLRLIGEYLSLFNFMPPSTLRAEYYMNYFDDGGRRNVTRAMPKLEPEVTIDYAVERREMRFRKRKHPSSKPEPPFEQCCDRPSDNGVDWKRSRVPERKQLSSESSDEEILLRKFRYTKRKNLQSCENGINYVPPGESVSETGPSKLLDQAELEQKLPETNEQLNQNETLDTRKSDDFATQPDMETIDYKDQAQNIINIEDDCEPNEKATIQYPTKKYRLVTSAKIDFPDLVIPIEPNNAYRATVLQSNTPIKPYRSEEPKIENNYYPPDNVYAGYFFEYLPYYQSMIKDGIMGSLEPSWFRTVFEVHKAEEIWIKHFYSMHKDYVDSGNGKLAYHLHGYKKLGY